jgi:hypothetical protein
MKRSPWLVFAIPAGVALLGLIIHNARYGAVSPRIRNPNDTGGLHPLSDPLFGYGHWIVTIEIFSYLALVSIIAAQGHGAGHAAMAATAMRVVNAVPYVVAAPAGLLSSLDIPNTFPRHVFQ